MWRNLWGLPVLGLAVLCLTACGSPTTAPKSSATQASAKPTEAPAKAAAPSTLVPTATAPPATNAPRRVYVGNTDGEGVFLRRTPAQSDRIKAFADGTALDVTGPPVQAEGQTWLPVRAPDGTDGFVPERYTVATAPVAPPPIAAPTTAPAKPAAIPTSAPTSVPAKPVAAPTSAPPKAAAVATAIPTARPANPTTAAPRTACCATCSRGKACGNSCINVSLTCHQPPGCACNALAPDALMVAAEFEFAEPELVVVGIEDGNSQVVEPADLCPFADLDPHDSILLFEIRLALRESS